MACSEFHRFRFKREIDVRRFGGGLVQAGLCCAEKLEDYIASVRAGGTLE